MATEMYPQEPGVPDRLVLTGLDDFSPREYAAFVAFSESIGLITHPEFDRPRLDPEFKEPQPPLIAKGETVDQQPDYELTQADFSWTSARYGLSKKAASTLYRTVLRNIGREELTGEDHEPRRRYISLSGAEQLFKERDGLGRSIEEVRGIGRKTEVLLTLVLADKRAQIEQAEAAKAKAA